MAKRSRRSRAKRGRRKKRRPASWFVSEHLLTGAKPVVSGDSFDAGYVKRRLDTGDFSEPYHKKKTFKSVTPARRRWPVLEVTDDEETNGLAEESPDIPEPQSWLNRLWRFFFPGRS